MDADSKLPPSATRWAIVTLAGYALTGGVLTLLGWFANLPRLTDWVNSGISMFPNAAFAAVCLGTALIVGMVNDRWCARASIFLGFLAACLGATTLAEHVFGVDLHIDSILIKASWGIRAATTVGRMGPPASTSYTLLGLAVIFAASGRSRARRLVPALAIGVALIGALSLIGYIFGASRLFAVARYSGIALQTASMLLALALALVVSIPECEPMLTLQQNNAAGLLARRALPFILIVPFALGWLRVRAQASGWFDTAMGTSLLTLLIIVIFCALLWWLVGAVAKYEEALHQSEYRVRAFLRNSAIIAWLKDEEGRHVFLSDNYVRRFGLRDWQNKTDFDLWPRAIAEEFRKNDLAVLAGEGPFECVEETRTADGNVSFWLNSKFWFADKSGKRYVGGVGVDVTRQKQTEEELRQAQKKLLLHAAELESIVAARTAELQESVNELQSFSYSLAHDLRAPLRAMGNFAELLMHETAAAGASLDATNFCRRIIVGAGRLDNLINDALNYTKAVLQDFPLRPVDLAKLLRGMLDTYPNLRAGEIELGEKLPVVLGNESLLTQCFSNLLGNAVKFMAPGVAPKVRVRAEATDGVARVWVEDNGIGIPQHAQSRLFVMFQKLDNEYEGTGIGLAIVRKAVQRMGGKVGVESEVGRGSRFWVELRVAPDAAK